MKNKILVLGADGFIGSNLVKSLLKKKNNEVIAFDLFKNGLSKNLLSNKNLKLFSGNFLNRSDLRNALIGVDYVFHYISLTTPGSSMNDPLVDVDTNIKNTIILLDECAKAGIKRIIFPSSGGAVYGNQNIAKYNENEGTEPISPYAISKLAIEKYIKYYKIHFKLDYLILRYSNVYGPGQNITGSQGIIPIFLNCAKNNAAITIFGDGKNVRDYIFVDDAVSITMKIYKKKLKHSLYNVGSGKGASINKVVSIIEKIVKKSIQKKYKADRNVDVNSVILDTRRIRGEIGKIKLISLEEGIKKTWDWINNQNF